MGKVVAPMVRALPRALRSRGSRRQRATLLLAALGSLVGSVFAPLRAIDNSVTVGSADVAPGQTSVTIPILISNSVSLKGIIIPLILRPVSGSAYVTSMQIQFGDRLYPGGPLNEIRFSNIQLVDGSCGAEGLGTILYSDQLSHAVDTTFGVDIVAQKLFSPDLSPGSDVTGSATLTFDVGTSRGIFEIDATCADPANTLLFVDTADQGITPTFQKGIVTVGLIFADGFESGSVCDWSSSAGSLDIC